MIQPHRRWIHQGELFRVRALGLIAYYTPVRLYLFNDILVIAEKLVSSFRYSITFALIETFAYPVVDNRAKHVFKIVSDQAAFFIGCTSERIMWDWVKTINDTTNVHLNHIQSNRGTGYHASRQELANRLSVDLHFQDDLDKKHLSTIDDVRCFFFSFYSSLSSLFPSFLFPFPGFLFLLPFLSLLLLCLFPFLSSSPLSFLYPSILVPFYSCHFSISFAPLPTSIVIRGAAFLLPIALPPLSLLSKLNMLSIRSSTSSKPFFFD